MPFAALIGPDRKYLVNHYTFTYLASGRDLPRVHVVTAKPASALVLGNPDYNFLPSRAGRRSAAFSLHFRRLASTAPEARAVAGKLGIAPLLDRAATKDAVMRATGPELLHIATHGFFRLPSESPSRGSRNVALVVPSAAAFVWLPQSGTDALARSGLALAGANRSTAGIITALEMSAMNLRGTRLITLSACETGVGEVRNGDGVYGFRRALLLAGARAQLISLWSVNDTATADLMAAFYERAVTKGSTLAAGLRESQKGLMTRHPYYWAAFILSGDGGPLKAN